MTDRFRVHPLVAVALIVFFLVSVGRAQELPKGGSGGSTKPRPKATPRPPAAPARGRLVVTTLPGAQVEINGKPIGKANDRGDFVQDLAPGSYALRVVAGDEYLPFTKTITLKKGATQPVAAQLVERYGSVAVMIPLREGATVFDREQPLARLVRDEAGKLAVVPLAEPAVGSKPIETRFDEPNGILVVRNLSVGEHLFSVRHPDFAPGEGKSLTVEAGRQSLVNLITQEILGELAVSTLAGASVYLDEALVGQTGADGTLTQTVPPGTHKVRIEKRGFQPAEESLRFEQGKTVRFERRLDPTLTRVAFKDGFDLNLGLWQAPEGWSISGKTLQVAGAPEPGLPTGIVYADLIAGFKLKLIDGAGAAWVVRAVDRRNYYLFYLTGSTAKTPNRLFTYVVRDGAFDVDRPAISPVPVASVLAPGTDLYVDVEVSGNTIRNRITPDATGVEEDLGRFEDGAGTFPFGSIGFRTVGSERFAVDFLYVDPPQVVTETAGPAASPSK